MLASVDGSHAEFDAEGEADFYSIPQKAPAVPGQRVPPARRSISDRLPRDSVPGANHRRPQALATRSLTSVAIILLTGTTGSGKSTTLAASPSTTSRTATPATRAHHHARRGSDRRPPLRSARSSTSARSVHEGFAQAMAAASRWTTAILRRCATRRPCYSAQRRRATWCSPPSTPSTRPRPSTGSSISSRPPLHQGPGDVVHLRGAVSTLSSNSDGNGRVAASEVMVMTGRVRGSILNPDETEDQPGDRRG